MDKTMTNPKTAVDAILNEDGQGCYALTIGRYALLELVDSPLTTGRPDAKPIDLIPTVYVMSRPIAELKGYGVKNRDELVGKAMEWSEGVALEDFAPMLQKVMDEIAKANKLAGGGAEEPSKKN